MEAKVGDIIKMKKPHPCGANAWEILRLGMDVQLRCKQCDRLVMLSRKQVEKGFRGVITQSDLSK